MSSTHADGGSKRARSRSRRRRYVAGHTAGVTQGSYWREDVDLWRNSGVSWNDMPELRTLAMETASCFGWTGILLSGLPEVVGLQVNAFQSAVYIRFFCQAASQDRSRQCDWQRCWGQRYFGLMNSDMCASRVQSVHCRILTEKKQKQKKRGKYMGNNWNEWLACYTANKEPETTWICC